MADLKRGDLQQDESAVADPRRKWSTIRKPGYFTNSGHASSLRRWKGFRGARGGTDDGFSGNSNQRFALAANCFDNGLDFSETPRL